ncbi:cell division septation protein DedD [Nakamurella sp. UYEF19]|uniref:glycoside hydrolase family 16 protein n=1 Tax=Nakamurella sp. UYEF19 TaxID=1756392 RepID=UPI003394745F
MQNRTARRRSIARRSATCAGIASIVAATLVTLVAPASAAGTTYTSKSLNYTVSGRTVTATSVVAASTPVTATSAGICALNSTNGSVDFSFTSNVTISTSGTTIAASRTLNPGSYTYWACAKVNGGWPTIGPRRTLVVPATGPTSGPGPTTPVATTTTPTTPVATTSTPTTPVATTSTPTTTTTTPAPGSSTSSGPPTTTPSTFTNGVYTNMGLSADVSNRTITATTVIAASTPTTATVAGICALNSTNGAVDFPTTANVVLTPSGTTITSTRVLSPGTYTYWGCVKVNGGWPTVSPRQTFYVDPTVAAPTAPAPVDSGQAMPIGDLPGWKQVFSDDFTTDVAMGGFPGSYASKWTAYDGFQDSSGNGMYSKDILSVHNGNLDMYLHTENGKALGAAPVPLVTGKWGGQTYGRFSVRFRSDYLPHFGTGWLLWPDSGNWDDGEIDFPEGGLDQVMSGYVHCIGHARDNCSYTKPGTTYYDWHTATIEWRADRVTMILDGKTILNDTVDVPVNPLHWVMQVGTSGGKPDPATAGHLLIDWVSIYTAV